MTTISRDRTSKWSSGPLWLRQRALGKIPRMRTSLDLIRRLKTEACFDGHREGSFHPTWNERGNLLTCSNSGSKAIVWDVFKQREECLVDTGHTNFIYSIKFMPMRNDTQIVTTSNDHTLRLTNLLSGENLLVCPRNLIDTHLYSHQLAVHASEPNLIWFNSADGCIAQLDIRQQPLENNDLKYPVDWPNCLAINPVRSEMLAAGTYSGYTHLIDRRVLKLEASHSSFSASFAPLYKQVPSGVILPAGVVNVTFNSDGSELLTSIDGDQVYLYYTYEPWQRYQSFDLTVKPLLSGEPEIHPKSDTKLPKPYSYLNELQKQRPVEPREEVRTLCYNRWSSATFSCDPSRNKSRFDHLNKLLDECSAWDSRIHQDRSGAINRHDKLPNSFIEYLNVLLDKQDNCPDLYRARAIALRRRDWSGDYHQSLRDCCCALALNPHDFRTIRCLSATLIEIGNMEDVCGLLEFVEGAIKKFGDDDELSRSRELLLAFKQKNESIFKPRDPSRHTGRPRFHVRVDVESSARTFDYTRRYHGPGLSGNFNTGAEFFGAQDEFVVTCCAEAAICIWDKNTTNIVRTIDTFKGVHAMPHPSICMLATSGFGNKVELLSPAGKLTRFVWNEQAYYMRDSSAGGR